jgi:hypothetical protein
MLTRMEYEIQSNLVVVTYMQKQVAGLVLKLKSIGLEVNFRLYIYS